MVSTAWLINGRGFAEKVKGSGLPADEQVKDCGAKIQCPKCLYVMDNSDVPYEWPGMPLGVRFQPTDVEMLKHLSDKCGVGGSKLHPFIEGFINTIEDDEGICYTHPENLPDSKKDGTVMYFFHKVAKAYTTGQRKRRRIENDAGHVRWHKTGKTKPVTENGVHKGCKKILVLHGVTTKGAKPHKLKWVMHQYHLGNAEDEGESEYVVSKIFCQIDKNETANAPTTPKMEICDPPRDETTPFSDYVSDDFVAQLLAEDSENNKDTSYPSHCTQLKWKTDDSGTLAGESKGVDLSGPDFLCSERYGSATNPGSLYPENAGALQAETSAPLTQVGGANASDAANQGDVNTCFGINLDDILLDTPPDFDPDLLDFGSQDSLLEWLNRF